MTSRLSGLLTLLTLAALAPARADVLTEPVSQLRYVVVEPAGGAADTAAPLLVCLHGRGDALETFRRGLRVAAPAARRFRCAFLQAPDPEKGWTRAELDGIARVASAVVMTRPTRGTLLLGYSSGAWIGAAACWRNPELFEGALLVGSIGLEPPHPRLARLTTPSIYWSLGTEDPAVTRNGGFDLAALERHLVSGGWAPERWRIDALQGKGHQLDGPSVERGLAWLALRLDATTPATEEDRAAAERVAALVAAGDLAALRALVLPIAASRRGEAKALLTTALLELPRARDPAASKAGIELLAALGDARAAQALAALLDRLGKDPPRQRAAIDALATLGGPDASGALVKLARKQDEDGAQVAAVHALARCGGRDDTAPLVAELEQAERGRQGELVDALNAALRELTGQEITGARMWKAWRDAVRKAERANEARERAASEREADEQGR